MQDVDSSESVYFASTANGWSCDKLGLDWLQRIFHRHTQYGRHGLGRRLLIVDGHSSHVNLKFINAADQLNILVLILPPHTTQRLQPLDVGLFGPLAKAYSAELLQIGSNSQYMTGITKRMFWSMFRIAWEKSFTEKNIVSAFKTTGIWPMDSSKTLTIITRPKSPEHKSAVLNTPISCRAVRREQKAWKANPTTERLTVLFKAMLKLATEKNITEFENKGLRTALQLERRKRQRGKRLNLVGEEEFGPQFYSPTKVQAAQAFANSQKAEVEKKHLEIEAKKRLANQKKEKKAMEAIEKANI